MTRLLLIATGGALGAVARYALSGWAYRLAGEGFPWGTLAVNLVGCFAIGLLWSAGERVPFAATWSAFLFVGFLGAFTTFSTFGIETLNLMRDGETLLAVINVAASNIGGFVLAYAGLHLGRMVWP